MNETFKCPICKAELTNPEELRQHRMTKHKGNLREVRLGS